MRIKKLIKILLFMISIVSCVPTSNSNITSPKPSPIINTNATPTLVGIISTPTVTTSKYENTKRNEGSLNRPVDQVLPYQDVRYLDLRKYGPLNASLIETLWFNQNTIWLPRDSEIAKEILELGKNPGFGIRSLHDQGFTGKGVIVAIIDQEVNIDHAEFQGKIARYVDNEAGQPLVAGSMHGPAVISLLVDDNIGTAPDAKVYYVAVPSWTGDAKYYAEALDWIIEQNKKLPEGEKIRAVSVSAALSGIWSDFSKNKDLWDAAFNKATETGVLVLDCSYEEGITLPCTYDLHNPDDVSECLPNYLGTPNSPHQRLFIPTSRTTAFEDGEKGSIYGYQFTGMGGISWTIPYLTGVLAMGWQINPNLSNSQIIELLYDSAYKTDEGLLIINPPAFITSIKNTTIASEIYAHSK